VKKKREGGGIGGGEDGRGERIENEEGWGGLSRVGVVRDLGGRKEKETLLHLLCLKRNKPLRKKKEKTKGRGRSSLFCQCQAEKEKKRGEKTL